MKSKIVWIAIAFFGAAVGCSEVTVEGGGPLTFSLTVDQATGVAGEDITFRYQASGMSLDGVILEYGDGIADSIAAFGAQSAAGQLMHAYADSGTFVVEGRAEEFGVRETDEVEVRITLP